MALPRHGLTSPVDLVIHSARVVSGGIVQDNGWVAFAGDTIAAVGSGEDWRDLSSTASVDARGAWLTPGFVDIHSHGAAGASYDVGVEACRRALHAHRSHGTTRSVLSLVTAPIEQLLVSLRSISDLCRDDPLVLGGHIEGPFLSREHKGAHNADFLIPPDAAVVDLLLEAGGGNLLQVTLAPELDDGFQAIRSLTDAGVAVAVGHTDATYEEALDAFEAGASILTHAFNAMNGLHHRRPGPVAAATATANVVLELINDGVHLHPEVVRMMFSAAPSRVALITDAMAAAAAKDGNYVLGSLDVTVEEGVARLRGDGSIAGSTLTQDEALRRTIACGVSVVDAVTAATETPARAIGRFDLGRIEPGCAADAVLLTDNFEVSAVWAAGLRHAFTHDEPGLARNEKEVTVND
jgi:N-acetylglucosamine-6-phosphate deacetylase